MCKKTTFRDRLLNILDCLGWTSLILHQETGIAESTISNWITKDRKPTGKSMAKIIAATGCNSSYLEDGEGYMFSGGYMKRVTIEKQKQYFALGLLSKEDVDPSVDIFENRGDQNTIAQHYCRQANAIQNANIDSVEIGTSHETAEESPKLVRMYRDLEPLSQNIILEIIDWLNDMEKLRPGFKNWWALEYQNRFPEFDEWLAKKRNRREKENM